MEIGKRLAERLTRFVRGRRSGGGEGTLTASFFFPSFFLRTQRDKGRFPTDVETVRFLCKEFWQELNGKTADGLHRNKNNKGLFQVEDKNLRFLARISSDANSTTVKEEAQKYTVLPCGIIKGALESFGYEAHVKCQITTIPGVAFSITLKEPT